MTFTPMTTCRSCGSASFFPVIDLGEQPLANALRRPDDATPEARFSLATVACAMCSLVQLTGTVDPSVLFDHYHYLSSFSTTMVDDMRSLAERVIDSNQLTSRSLVVEVASNDGYLLQHYVALGIPVTGIDPARNVAEIAIERGIPTEVTYFGIDVADRLRAGGRGADVIHANNVMAHVPDINDFVGGLARLLAVGGVAIVETPHLVPFVERAEFDTIYHEHVFYYSLTAIDALVARHGLVVADVEQLDIHGGSLRLFIRHAGAAVTGDVDRIRAHEARVGVATPQYYDGFAVRVGSLRRATVELLSAHHERGRSLAGYGAAAKGTVLLNHFGIGTDLLDFVVDRNPLKQGLLVPGVGIPISDPERLIEDRPDYVLLLTWNFADEIIGQQAAYLEGGGRFIVPIPELSEVGA